MDKKAVLSIILIIVLITSVGTILLINQTGILSEWNEEAISLLKQYLKVFAFLSVMGLVYLRFKKSKTDEKIEK